MVNRIKKLLRSKYSVILIIFLLADIGYSFYQDYRLPLHGDFADIVFPNPHQGFYKVLQDPFGLSVAIDNESYPNPNRFFAHFTTSIYFKNVPLLFQSFFDPITSVYLSVALAKIVIQILLITLLAFFISGMKKIFTKEFLVSAVLITPFFQTYGYNRYMGIIDQSAIYTFFYALPLALLLLFFLFLLRPLFSDSKKTPEIIMGLFLTGFAIFISLNGPLVPGVVLIVCPLIYFYFVNENWKQFGRMHSFKRLYSSLINIPKKYILYSGIICLLSLYSLYIGMNNSLNNTDLFPLWDRYKLVPVGIFILISEKLGFPLLLIAIIANTILIAKTLKSCRKNEMLRFILWGAIFILIYIILLPLGGYRIYRPYTVRYDTIIPITLTLLIIFGSSSLFLLKHLSKHSKVIYQFAIAFILIFFTINDNLDLSDNSCEIESLEKLSTATEKIVTLDCCPVMSWRPITDYKDSEHNAALFQYWNITKEKKLYFNKCD